MSRERGAWPPEGLGDGGEQEGLPGGGVARGWPQSLDGTLRWVRLANEPPEPRS